jgi:hypothetical protein
LRVKIEQVFLANLSIAYPAQVYNMAKAAKKAEFMPEAAMQGVKKIFTTKDTKGRRYPLGAMRT